MKTYFTGGRRVAASPVCSLLLMAACTVALAGTGCRRSAGSTQGVSIYEEITPQSVRIGEAAVTVQLADRAANPVSGATVMVEADMRHPGMSPVFGLAKETRPGYYRTHINFNMGGDWVVLLHIKLANGKKIEQQMDVRGVRSS